MYRKSATSAQTDGRIATDEPLYAGADSCYLFSTVLCLKMYLQDICWLLV